jgi:hypothetical protein
VTLPFNPDQPADRTMASAQLAKRGLAGLLLASAKHRQVPAAPEIYTSWKAPGNKKLTFLR